VVSSRRGNISIHCIGSCARGYLCPPMVGPPAFGLGVCSWDGNDSRVSYIQAAARKVQVRSGAGSRPGQPNLPKQGSVMLFSPLSRVQIRNERIPEYRQNNPLPVQVRYHHYALSIISWTRAGVWKDS
jgi:hypothetical protein